MQDPGAAPYDIAAEWEHLRIYFAMHKQATELVGRGVISFTGEFIEGTRDSNWGSMGADMVIRHGWRVVPYSIGFEAQD